MQHIYIYIYIPPEKYFRFAARDSNRNKPHHCCSVMKQQYASRNTFCGLARKNSKRCHKWFIKLWINNVPIKVENTSSLLPDDILICYMSKEWNTIWGRESVDTNTPKSSLWINFSGGGKSTYTEINHYIKEHYNNQVSHIAEIEILNENQVKKCKLEYLNNKDNNNNTSSSESESSKSESEPEANASDSFDTQILNTHQPSHGNTDISDLSYDVLNDSKNHYGAKPKLPLDRKSASIKRTSKVGMLNDLTSSAGKNKHILPSSQESLQDDEIITQDQQRYNQAIKVVNKKKNKSTNRYATTLLYYCPDELWTQDTQGFELFVQHVNEFNSGGAKRRPKPKKKTKTKKLIKEMKDTDYEHKSKIGITKHILTKQLNIVEDNPLYDLLKYVRQIDVKSESSPIASKKKKKVKFGSKDLLKEWKRAFKREYNGPKLGQCVFINIIEIAKRKDPTDNELTAVIFTNPSSFHQAPAKLNQILRILYCEATFVDDWRRNHAGIKDLKHQLDTTTWKNLFDCIPRAYILIIHEMLYCNEEFSDALRNSIMTVIEESNLSKSWKFIMNQIYNHHVMQYGDKKEQKIWEPYINNLDQILDHSNKTLSEKRGLPDLNNIDNRQLRRKSPRKRSRNVKYNFDSSSADDGDDDDDDDDDDDNDDHNNNNLEPTTKRRKYNNVTITNNKKKGRKKKITFNEQDIINTLRQNKNETIITVSGDDKQYPRLINNNNIFNLLSIIVHKFTYQNNNNKAIYIETLPVQLTKYFNIVKRTSGNFYKLISWFVEGVSDSKGSGNKVTNSINQSIQSIIQNKFNKSKNNINDFQFGVIIPFIQSSDDGLDFISSIQYALYVYHVTNIELQVKHRLKRSCRKNQSNIATYDVTLNVDNVECAIWSNNNKIKSKEDVMDGQFVSLNDFIIIGKCIEHYINSKQYQKKRKIAQKEFLSNWKNFEDYEYSKDRPFYYESNQKTPLSTYIYLEKRMRDYISSSGDENSLSSKLLQQNGPNYDDVYSKWMECLSNYSSLSENADADRGHIEFGIVSQQANITFSRNALFTDYVLNGIDVKLCEDKERIGFWTNNYCRSVINCLDLDNSNHDDDFEILNDVESVNNNNNITSNEISLPQNENEDNKDNEEDVNKNNQSRRWPESNSDEDNANDKEATQNKWNKLKQSLLKVDLSDLSQMNWEATKQKLMNESKTKIWGHAYQQYKNTKQKLMSLAIQFDSKPKTISEFRVMYKIMHDLGQLMKQTLYAESLEMHTNMEKLDDEDEEKKYPDLFNHFKEKEYNSDDDDNDGDNSKCLFCQKHKGLNEHTAFNFKQMYTKLNDEELKEKVTEMYECIKKSRLMAVGDNTKRFDLELDSFIHWTCLFQRMIIITDEGSSINVKDATDSNPEFVVKESIEELCQVILEIWNKDANDFDFASSNVLKDNYNISTQTIQQGGNNTETKHEWIDSAESSSIKFKLIWQWTKQDL